jgi:hypothetical protein
LTEYSGRSALLDTITGGDNVPGGGGEVDTIGGYCDLTRLRHLGRAWRGA